MARRARLINLCVMLSKFYDYSGPPSSEFFSHENKRSKKRERKNKDDDVSFFGSYNSKSGAVRE